MATRIVLADDHEMVRAGLRSILERQPDIEVIGEAGDGRQAVQLARTLRPDIVIMDITMPGLNGVEATRQILGEQAELAGNGHASGNGNGDTAATPPAAARVRIIALSVHPDRQFVREMLNAGASAYLVKNSAVGELQMAIKSVMEGHIYLSPKVTDVVVEHYVLQTARPDSTVFGVLTAREREVLQVLAEGKTNREIAEALNVSVKTVETHRAQIMAKLGIHSVAGLTKYAIRQGLTLLDS